MSHRAEAKETTPSLTLEGLHNALYESINTSDTANWLINLSGVKALVGTLGVTGAGDTKTFGALTSAFVKYHELALADAIALLMWEVVKVPAERQTAFHVTLHVFEELIKTTTARGNAQWQLQVETPLNKVPESNGQTKAANILSKYADELNDHRRSANQWARKTLYDKVLEEVDKRDVRLATLQSVDASVRVARYTQTMRNLTIALVGATIAAAVSAAAQAIPAWEQWRHPAAPVVVEQLMSPPCPKLAPAASNGATVAPSNKVPPGSEAKGQTPSR